MKIRNSELLNRWTIHWILDSNFIIDVARSPYRVTIGNLLQETYYCSRLMYKEVQKLKQNTLLGIIYGKELSDN